MYVSFQPSHVKIIDIHFKNIRGTSATPELLTFACSKALPCEAIEVADVNLIYEGKAILHKNPVPGNNGQAATCLNAKVVFGGKHEGIDCKSM